MSHKLYVIAKKTGKFLSRRRWSFLGSHLASAINQLFYSMSNVDFDMKTNGESRALTICRDFFEERSIFFDVGANVGDWTHQAVSTFPGCTCYAFEVVPETSEMLKERYKNNQRVIVHNFGLSDRECTLDIYKPVKPGANASAFLIQDVSKRNMAYSEKYECKARPGAAFMSEKDLTKIDFLKIDVEGMELSVLKGFDQMIDKVRII